MSKAGQRTVAPIDVKALVEHPDFSWTNPNRMRSVVSVFAGNLPHFHAEGGEAYAWLGDVVEKVWCRPNRPAPARPFRSKLGDQS